MAKKVKFELAAQKRVQIGTGASRRLRKKEGLVPAIVYGAGKEPAPITLAHNKVVNALEHEGFYSHILTLTIDEQPEQVVLKALQRHPYKKQILHLDFQRIRADEELNMHIPVHFIGETTAAGLRNGGVLTHHMTEIEIRCLPADLPECIEIEVSHLDIGQAVHLNEIKLPKGVEIVALLHGEDNNAPVVSIHLPRTVVETEVTAPVETEITGQKAVNAEEAAETSKK